ncbi:hypothetical protein AAFN88_09215 [Pelagibius sp. CAU 1746]|uniref:hypothetical protein n=1 Tax=Pelagibius sp. CAU 1746 TaxID=3140370 RepID=UPI00325B8883
MIEQHAVRKTAARRPAVSVAQREPARRERPGAEPPGRKPQGETADWIVGEPSVEDLLRDPLIHAVLRRDGLGLQDLLQAVALGRSRLAPPRVENDAA